MSSPRFLRPVKSSSSIGLSGIVNADDAQDPGSASPIVTRADVAGAWPPLPLRAPAAPSISGIYALLRPGQARNVGAVRC